MDASYEKFQHAKALLLAGIIGHYQVMIRDADCGSPMSLESRDQMFTRKAREAVAEYDALLEDREAVLSGVLKA